VKLFPKAFNVVLCDALYARAPFIRLVRSHNKDIICVLKDERRELIKDAEGIFSQQQPLRYKEGKTHYRVFDEENFTSWEGLDIPVRVVKSVETTITKNYISGTIEKKTTTWMWVTTISKQRLGTKEFVALAHKRWSIENNGFKEMVHLWHGDHVYHHNARAVIAFWLTIMIAYNIIHAFVGLNIKPAFRQRHTFLHFTQMIKAGIYAWPAAPP